MGDTFEICPYLPSRFADLPILDPPHNLTRNFGGRFFRKKPRADYAAWFKKLIELLLPALKPTATVYVCSDWATSTLGFPILDEHFHVRNRITWEREKGRGAKTNWKSSSEDIWFCTMCDRYHVDVEAVKIKRRVLAPYRRNGVPQDWNTK